MPATIVKNGGHAIQLSQLRVLTAYYNLAQAENRVMVEWLLGDRQYDVRFRLAELLHSNGVREAFSLIIIDSPPRLTTGAIQALAAGPHLLVPIILDEPSSEAVVTFIRQVETYR
jgi:chromosome partitioning protein